MSNNQCKENAFTINRLNGAFFPLSLKVTRSGRLTSAFFCAQRLVDVCDCIEAHALERLVVWGVDQTSCFHEDSGRFCSLRELAGLAGVTCTAVDDDTIVLASADLRRLLESFSHSSLCLFDLPADYTELDVVRQIVTCQEWPWQEREFVLAALPASHSLLLSHDDCYLTLQTDQAGFVRRVFARLLAAYTSAVWAELTGTPVEVPEISDSLLEPFWQETFGLCVLRQDTHRVEEGLIIGVAPQPFDFRDGQVYSVAWSFRFNAQTGQWTIA